MYLNFFSHDCDKLEKKKIIQCTRLFAGVRWRAHLACQDSRNKQGWTALDLKLIKIVKHLIW